MVVTLAVLGVVGSLLVVEAVAEIVMAPVLVGAAMDTVTDAC